MSHRAVPVRSGGRLPPVTASAGEARSARPGPEPVPVLFVSSHAQLGGGEGYLRSIVEGLGPAWCAGIVSLHDGPFVQRLRDGGHEVTVLPAEGRTSVLGAARRLRGELRRTRPAVVHANGIKAALVAVLARGVGGPPVVWLKYDFGWDGAMAAFVALRSRMVVGISGAVNETFGRLTRRRARVVYAGVPEYPDAEAQGPRALAAVMDRPADGPVIALSGRLCPGKGQTDMVAAMPTVLARHPDATLLLLGVEDSFYPGYRATLEEQARGLGVHDAVCFARLAGHMPAEAVSVVSACDVLVQPSRLQERGGWREGFGLAVVEAMQVGTPVVAYANGALPEVVGDVGVVVPEGDHVALGTAVADLLDDPERARALVAAARVRERERYRLDRVIAQMADCYVEAAR